VLRWLLRLARERTLITPRQVRYVCLALEERGRMLGGWLKQASGSCARSSAETQTRRGLGANAYTWTASQNARVE